MVVIVKIKKWKVCHGDNDKNGYDNDDCDNDSDSHDNDSYDDDDDGDVNNNDDGDGYKLNQNLRIFRNA